MLFHIFHEYDNHLWSQVTSKLSSQEKVNVSILLTIYAQSQLHAVLSNEILLDFESFKVIKANGSSVSHM
jgi:hypothetical protein